MLVGEDGEVNYDSAGILASGASIHETERTSLVPASRIRLSDLTKGRFVVADGSEWLFIAQPLFPRAQMMADTSYLLIAAPVPRATLGEVFRLFGDTFFAPLAQAGLVDLDFSTPWLNHKDGRDYSLFLAVARRPPGRAWAVALH